MLEPMQGNNWLQGRHALITGGGTGIGASVATHLHAAGAKLFGFFPLQSLSLQP